jgi:hypothetical protein
LQHLPNFRVSRVYSRRLVHDLRAWGIVERKSFVGLSIHPKLAAFPSFWLGVIDGDGSIFQTRRATVVLWGHPQLIAQYREFLAATVLAGRRQAIRTRADGLAGLTLDGRSAITLLRLLYRSSPVSLERKRVVAERLLADARDVALLARDERQAFRHRRLIWQGTTEPRKHHVAPLREFARAVLASREGFTELVPWKPSPRSSMVAFRGNRGGREALVWVTCRWKACIPQAILATSGRHELFALHLSPRDPSVHFLASIRDRNSSSVPTSFLIRTCIDSNLQTELAAA